MKTCDVCETGSPVAWAFGKHVRCEAHDVCICCDKKRKDMTSVPWGTRMGIKCQECEELRKASAIEQHTARDLDNDAYEHTDRPICPYCGDINCDDESRYIDVDDIEIQCGNCDSFFLISSSISVSYTTAKIAEEKAK